MARFLFTAWPFMGHVNPLLCVAQAVRARGHDVAFYSGEPIRPLLEAEGFRVFPFRRVRPEAAWEAIREAEIRAPTGKSSVALLRLVFRDWLAGTLADQVADVRAILRAWRPAAVATDPMMWGPSLILAETSEVPVAVVSIFPGCLLPGPDAPPWGPGLPPPRTPATRLLARAATLANHILASGLRRRVNRVRADHGLPPMTGSVMGHLARLPLHIVPSIPELDYGRADLPPTVHYVGPCLWNKPSRWEEPAWLAELPTDRPWVHVTEGTAHHQDPFVLRATARALAGRPMEVILTTGPHRDPAALDLGPPAPNVHVAPWVSHGDLLPRCAAMVSTGGPGTVLAALRAGIPQVIIPTHWEKPDNAQRVVSAGAALRIAPQKLDPARLRAAVERVLAEPGFRDNARRLAGLLEAAPGPPRAAELLESLALSHNRRARAVALPD